MPRIRILEAAALEAVAAARWYDVQRPGLGAEFAQALAAILDHLQDRKVPLRTLPGSSADDRLRRLTLKRFPFDVVVMTTDDEITIVAFAHHARRPGYWRGRVPEEGES